MLDRMKVEAILMRRFVGAQPQQIAAAANAIMGLGDEWEEVVDGHGQDTARCGCEGCSETDLRMFRRRLQ